MPFSLYKITMFFMLSYTLYISNQTGDDTAEAGGRIQRRQTTGVQVDTHREKAGRRRRKPYKQRREEVRKVSKKRESERYLITNTGDRHRRKYPQNAPQAPNLSDTGKRRIFAHPLTFCIIWKKYGRRRKHKKEHRQRQGKTDTAKPYKQRL